MQDAYAAEKETIGSFQNIGYVPPGTKQQSGGYKTTTFTYTETTTAATGEGASGNSQEVWTATSEGKMNDCAKGSTWTITTTMTAAANTATQGTLTHVAGVTDAGGTNTNCSTLTPSFENIGNSAAQ